VLTLKKQTALALGIANGLAAIHAAGVLHLDLKPANVLIVGDIPKLADFGSADLVIHCKTTCLVTCLVTRVCTSNGLLGFTRVVILHAA
jgi:serine/threonine protein kinase